MRISKKALAAAALATLVPQMVQAAEYIYVTPYANTSQSGLANAPIRAFDSATGNLVVPSFTGTIHRLLYDMAFDSAGNAYTTDNVTNTVDRYDTNGAALTPPTLSAPATPFSVAVGPLDGALYVASSNTNTAAVTGFTRFANPASAAPTVSSPSIADAASFIAFDPVTSGGVQTLYVSTYNGASGGAVRKVGLNASGAVVVAESDFISAATLNMNEPEGIAIGGGFLFVSDPSTGNINRYDLATATGGFFVNAGAGVRDLVLDSTGSLYAINFNNWLLTKYTAAGAVDVSWGNSISPNDGPGQVYMDNTPSLLNDGGDYAPHGLAIRSIADVAVPEPGSLALLGLGAMACTFFRRARAQ